MQLTANVGSVSAHNIESKPSKDLWISAVVALFPFRPENIDLAVVFWSVLRVVRGSTALV